MSSPPSITTVSYEFGIPPGVGDRLSTYAWMLVAYVLGLAMNLILFVWCLHLYKTNYGIIILNQLLIGIVYALLNLIDLIFVYILIGIEIFAEYYWYVPNPPGWAWFLVIITSDGGSALFYVQPASLLLLCTNRWLTILDISLLKRWMTYKMHIVYSAVCWLLVLMYIVDLTTESIYLLVMFMLTLIMCIGLYIKLYIHLRSTVISLNDRERYRQMRSISNIALMQTLFPIITYLPTSIEYILFVTTDFDYIYFNIIMPSPLLTFILSIPVYTQPYCTVLIALSIIVALGDLRRKARRLLTYVPIKMMSTMDELRSKKNKVTVIKVQPAALTVATNSHR